MYSTALERCENNDRQDTYGGAPVTQRTDVQTDLSFYRAKIMQVPFGEWLPDQPEHLKQGANVATNVYHTINSYKRFPSLVSKIL